MSEYGAKRPPGVSRELVRNLDAQGLSTTQISKALDMSYEAVRKHLLKIRAEQAELDRDPAA